MLNKNGERELAYVVNITDVKPIEGADNVELSFVNGWSVMTRKGQFKPGDLAIYFEIDSKVPEKEPFLFLAAKDYKIKTQKYFKGKVISQGLLMSFEDFGWDADDYIAGDFVTAKIGVTHIDNEPKEALKLNKYEKMYRAHKKLFKKYALLERMYNSERGKKILYFFLKPRKPEKDTAFPTKFDYVKKTDQERVENMPWVLENKNPFIVTEKCDGSSGTYILERKCFGKFEFYVCSRNVRMLNKDQDTFFGKDNPYWDVAIKYDIEKKMRHYMMEHPDLEYLCWQGEICSPNIQKNPHGLSELHFYCFHMIDSKIGKWNMYDAQKVWRSYNMETVPIVDLNFTLPDTMEEFKKQADGYYSPAVCENKKTQPREGYVYYSVADPNFSFKNVSIKYLMNH